MVQLAQNIIDAAQVAQKKWKIPASITLAQYGLESAWGKKVSGKNNYFGIKGKGTVVTTHEVIKGQYVRANLEFQDYDSIADCFDDHGKLLATSKYYVKARTCLPDSIKFAHALTGVYATDPKYGDLLEKIITGSGLLKYDQLT